MPSSGIADSAFNAQELTDLGYARTSVVPILLDVAELDAAPADPRPSTACGRDGRRRRRLAVRRPARAEQGATRPREGVRRVPPALRRPDARLHLVGGSSSHQYETALAAFVDALDLGDAVEITGGVSAGAR